jgi:hypothetical protein
MKAHLMHADRDFDLQGPLPANAEALVQDLELKTLLDVMAGGDEFLFDVARRALLCSLVEPDAVTYRQRVLADSLAHPSVLRAIYDLAVEAILGEKRVYWGLLNDSPETILSRSVQVLGFFLDVLRRLRTIAEEHAQEFTADGFTRFFDMLRGELDDAYLREVADHLKELKLERGVLFSASLGPGNKGTHYVLRRAPRPESWLERLSLGPHSGDAFQLADRDEAGFRALSDLRGAALNTVANAVAQSSDHILSFFHMVRAELAFYIGCLNLHEQLDASGRTWCFPTPMAVGSAALSARELSDASLALVLGTAVVANDLCADGTSLIMITGANQGGKSTFLRSVGLAQLMLQCGMFVLARESRASLTRGVFTHYKREEDVGMRSGKLDEELGRMSAIADAIGPYCLLLCNESFASTNEREGSEIARQIVRALLEADVRVVFVTHLFDLSHGLYELRLERALFLRAERRDDGGRTFRLVEAEPLPTSYGKDSYLGEFGGEREPPHEPECDATVSPRRAGPPGYPRPGRRL